MPHPAARPGRTALFVGPGADVRGTVAPSGRVNGDDGDDTLMLAVNNGVVCGGPGMDACVVASGTPAVNR
ncbi:hypothetical protein [Streptomyces marincola]|uniref:hypothetical protein n=1 Tax=Streptomyces marincola TaxID=2878388 RepID=UPI001CF22D9F|nr:hypothetical protein [Streptomyces marincola]UCM87713.1 hypothetical protein LC193_06995 [Streptomyces marincola]